MDQSTLKFHSTGKTLQNLKRAKNFTFFAHFLLKKSHTKKIEFYGPVWGYTGYDCKKINFPNPPDIGDFGGVKQRVMVMVMVRATVTRFV